MTAFDRINNMCSTIRTRLAASSALSITDENGDSVVPNILDRDENPAVLADSPEGLPAICVIPLGDKAADSNFFMSGSEVETNFNIVIAGYYRASSNETNGEDIYTDIANLRQKAFSCEALFQGDNAYFSPGVVYHTRVELGYYEIVDYVIYKFLVTLGCKTIACGS